MSESLSRKITCPPTKIYLPVKGTAWRIRKPVPPHGDRESLVIIPKYTAKATGNLYTHPVFFDVRIVSGRFEVCTKAEQFNPQHPVFAAAYLQALQTDPQAYETLQGTGNGRGLVTYIRKGATEVSPPYSYSFSAETCARLDRLSGVEKFPVIHDNDQVRRQSEWRFKEGRGGSWSLAQLAELASLASATVQTILGSHMTEELIELGFRGAHGRAVPEIWGDNVLLSAYPNHQFVLGRHTLALEINTMGAPEAGGGGEVRSTVGSKGSTLGWQNRRGGR